MTTATADPITVKLSRMFVTIDIDGDGYVDAVDYH